MVACHGDGEVVVVTVVHYTDVADMAMWHGLWGWFWHGCGELVMVAAAVVVVVVE
jgi:hypothetical protein